MYQAEMSNGGIVGGNLPFGLLSRRTRRAPSSVSRRSWRASSCDNWLLPLSGSFTGTDGIDPHEDRSLLAHVLGAPTIDIMYMSLHICICVCECGALICFHYLTLFTNNECGLQNLHLCGVPGLEPAPASSAFVRAKLHRNWCT